jgi:2-polyprenyl-3-methyl-5-hydroxy-6-metoxy-1,4-benzoquinol methylase
MTRIHYTHCPVCGSVELSNRFQAKDNTVSGELFQVTECHQCTLRFTQDVPDESSISPYYKSENYISHTNTARGLINRLYHFVRKRTLVSKRKLIQQATGLQTGKLLDMGSGIGSFLQEMKKNGWETTGLEPDPDARKVAKELYNVELAEMNGFSKLPAGNFDVITLWHVLEHVHDLGGYVQRLKLLLKDTGRIFIAVPNYTATDASVYKEYWAAYDVPRHLYHFSPRSMQTLMNKNGLNILQYKPMWYDSFYISMLSSKYKNGKTNLAGACWNGLKSNLKAIGDVKKCSSVIYIIGKGAL